MMTSAVDMLSPPPAGMGNSISPSDTGFLLSPLKTTSPSALSLNPEPSLYHHSSSFFHVLTLTVCLSWGAPGSLGARSEMYLSSRQMSIPSVRALDECKSGADSLYMCLISTIGSITSSEAASLSNAMQAVMPFRIAPMFIR